MPRPRKASLRDAPFKDQPSDHHRRTHQSLLPSESEAPPAPALHMHARARGEALERAATSRRPAPRCSSQLGSSPLQYKRSVLVSYLDDELLVVRDELGRPDILVRVDGVPVGL